VLPLAKKGGTDTGSEVAAARSEEQARQKAIRDGTTKIEDLFDGQFNDDFFKGRAKSYEDYALPQVADQFGDASKQLTFSLARRGALDSTSRASLATALEKKRALQEQAIKDQGQTFANTAKANVEGARGDLVNTLNATGDVDAAVRGATTRAQVLSAVPGYSPVSQLFADFTSGLGQQAAAERAYSYGGPRPTFNTGLFAPRSGSVVNG
jgi:hypothetical protein